MVSGLGGGPEFDLIRRFLRDAAAPDRQDVRVAAGDDAAVVAGDGIAVTVDMAVEDVHFRRAWITPAEVGYRVAAGAISDLAAMGARPIGVLASIALGPGDERAAGEAVIGGVREAAGSVGAALIGGDLVRSPSGLILDIVALGEAPAPVLRSGARSGDHVWVTGTLGGAAAAVEAWLRGDDPDPAAREAFARPRPRTREALWLVERGVPSAMIDLSDGIAGDAAHIAAASGARLVIRAAALPVAAAARGDVRLAAAGGEDYELCFTAAPGAVESVREAFESELGVPLTRVGAVEEGEGAVVVDDRGKRMELRGFQHWREGP